MLVCSDHTRSFIFADLNPNFLNFIIKNSNCLPFVASFGFVIDYLSKMYFNQSIDEPQTIFCIYETQSY